MFYPTFDYRFPYIQVPRTCLDVLIQQACDGYPHEVCGIMAGKEPRISRILPISNVSPTPLNSFIAHRDEMAQALNRISRLGLYWLATYHTHPPDSHATLSEKDVSGANDNPWVPLHLLALPTQDCESFTFKVFRVRYGEVTQIRLDVLEQE